MRMDRLPDEILLQILSLLDTLELVNCQLVSHRFELLCRDDNIWKNECFDSSRAEARRKRHPNPASNAQLDALRTAVTDLSGQLSVVQSATEARIRAFANWDPAYPQEHPDYYEEYIHRHAPINLGWLRIPSMQNGQTTETSEATGVGLLQSIDSGASRNIVAPLDDGSVCIWSLPARETGQPPTQGCLVGRSSIGLLSGTNTKKHTRAEIRAIMTETGAVESVSIDNWQNRAFFAQNNTLVEVDLATLQAVSFETYPFPINALSQIHERSLVVGTNNTIHIHDPRNKSKSALDPSLTVEVIGGPTASHATLAQPGPLSILNRVEDDSVWVAGRFTHLLNYDRRFFPRLCGTIHSGARISCITTRPFPLIPRSMDLLQDVSVGVAELTAAKSMSGSTLLAAGEYKGKGSLEHYNLSPPTSGQRTMHCYQNRQTASSNKLLSVASHGLSTVFSDGDGNIKWVERNGSTPIRIYNINEPIEPLSFNQAQSTAQIINARDESAQGDIVQKILPLHHSQMSPQGTKRIDINQSDLLLKTGDGKIGILGFGHDSLYGREELEEKAESVEQRARRDAEKSYQDSMARLLQRHADEAKFIRLTGIGLRPAF